jgi:hypothetical protein
MVGSNGEKLITQTEAAKKLKKSLASVSNLVRRKRLRSEEVYGKRLVYLSDVISFKPIKEGRPAKKQSTKKRARKAQAKELERSVREGAAILQRKKPAGKGTKSRK